MKKRNQPRRTAETETCPTSWTLVLLTVVCVGLLASGFFFAARQHFMAMDLGIKNSKLRKQVDDMEGEKRRLLLSREIVRSPSEIKRIAMKHGLRDGDDLFDAVNTGQSGDPTLIVRTAIASPAKAAGPKKKEVKAFFQQTSAKTQPATKSQSKENPGQAKRIPNELVATTRGR